VNAVGGGLLRDVLVRDEPLIFKPGEFYAVAALAGCLPYVVVVQVLQVPSTAMALATIVISFSVRILSMRLGWRTGALWDEEGRSGP
jgi:uncharacterized membrane protein YeiH